MWGEGRSGLREREGRALFKGKTSLAVHQEFTHIYTLKLLVFFFFWGGGGVGGRRVWSQREKAGRCSKAKHH